MAWWKRALRIGAAAVPGVSAVQAVTQALDVVAETDDDRRAVETLRPKLARHASAAAAEVAKAELAHRSILVAGWRPALGWVCVAIMIWTYLLYDLVSVVWTLPPRDGELVTVLMTALGIAALRTAEKASGLTR